LSEFASQLGKLTSTLSCCDVDDDANLEVELDAVEPRPVSELKQQLLEAGNTFRTTPAQRQEFVAAFKRYHAEVGEKMYLEYRTTIEAIKAAHPEVAHIPTDDLIALRGWTSGDYILVQNALDMPKPEQFADALPYLRAIMSAYHALPKSFIYTGTVYTGERQTAEWVNQRYKVGETITNWRFFAASETVEGKWPDCNVNWDSESVHGKRISLFSERPKELEVLFVPATQQNTLSLTVKKGTEHRTFPDIDIRQKEVVEI